MSVLSAARSDTDEARERIIEAAEDLLRRYGPGKTKVVDVAQRLGMSHAGVYHYFESKAAILDVVVRRWLARVSAPLAVVVAGKEPASARMRAWARQLIEIEQRNFQDDSDLFETYCQAAKAATSAVEAFKQVCRDQLAEIITDGVANGEFAVKNVQLAALSFHLALMRIAHPHFIKRNDRRVDAVEPLLELLIAGLKAGVV